MIFDKEPVEVSHYMLKYNPKTKNLEVKNSRWFWKKPIWTKNCIYYGDSLKENTSALGVWYYDSYLDRIYICLSSTN